MGKDTAEGLKDAIRVDTADLRRHVDAVQATLGTILRFPGAAPRLGRALSNDERTADGFRSDQRRATTDPGITIGTNSRSCATLHKSKTPDVNSKSSMKRFVDVDHSIAVKKQGAVHGVVLTRQDISKPSEPETIARDTNLMQPLSARADLDAGRTTVTEGRR